MNADELKKCISEHSKNQSAIADDLGISSGGFSKWVNGQRSIDDRDAKLLRLYFYGEIPFDDIRPTQDLSSVLKFSKKEWDIITILATRSGKTAGEWIASQIREYLLFLGDRKSRDAPPLKETHEQRMERLKGKGKGSQEKEA